MKVLAFERRYRLASTPCPRCAGAGIYAHPARNASRDCLNCRGLGRHLSRTARELWREICEQLGAPVRVRESRIQPKHLEQILARDVRPGMAIAPLETPRPRAKLVRAVTPIGGSVRIRFADRTVRGASELESFARTLTPAELTRVDALLADRLGQGAELVRKALPRVAG